MHRTLRITTIGLLATLAIAARAQTEDPLTLTASYTLQTDSNLFRLPASANTQALIGKSDASEQIGVSTLGVAFKTRQSLQQFELSATLVDNQYQNFGYLSYSATNYDAAWRWSLTPRFRGSLTTTRKETLNSFADFTGLNTRNLRLDTGTTLDTEYEIDGPWRLVGGLSNTRQENQAAAVAGSDFSATAANVGVRYAFTSGSTATYRLSTNQGDYLRRTLPSAALLDNAYRQLDHDLRLRWLLSGNSTLDANLTYVTRSHPNYSQRDYDGFSTGANLNWLLTGKTSVALGYAHTLGEYATASSNYSQTDSLTIGPVWQYSPKIVLRMQAKFDQVQYLGSPTATPAAARRDTNREATLSVGWQPYQKVSVGASLGSLSRGSNLAGQDYDATQLNFYAQLNF